jgi:hypothetical protein
MVASYPEWNPLVSFRCPLSLGRMSLLRLRHNSLEICRFRMRRSCLTSKMGSEIDMRDTIAMNCFCNEGHAQYWCSCFQIRVYVSSDRKGSLWRQYWHSNAGPRPMESLSLWHHSYLQHSRDVHERSCGRYFGYQDVAPSSIRLEMTPRLTTGFFYLIRGSGEASTKLCLA